MAGKTNYEELKKLQRQLQEAVNEMPTFTEKCVKELAARLLAKVAKRTPVGLGAFEVMRNEKKDIIKYKKGRNKGKVKLVKIRNGGVLRKGWTIGGVKRKGSGFEIEVINQTPYASYVEFGHRQTPGRYIPSIGKRTKKTWVKGRFMLTISEQELKRDAPAILQKKLDGFVSNIF